MFGLTILAVFALVIGAVLYARKAAPKVVGVCFLIVGIGAAGWAGDLLARLGGWIGTASNSVGVKLVGAGLAGAVTAGVLTWLYLDFRKKGKVSKALPWLALVTPALLPAFFGSLAAVPALSGIASSASSLYASIGG